MAKKQFKTESKKLLDMMVNSIYTHKEIFLRELISNTAKFSWHRLALSAVYRLTTLPRSATLCAA